MKNFMIKTGLLVGGFVAGTAFGITLTQLVVGYTITAIEEGRELERKERHRAHMGHGFDETTITEEDRESV